MKWTEIMKRVRSVTAYDLLNKRKCRGWTTGSGQRSIGTMSFSEPKNGIVLSPSSIYDQQIIVIQPNHSN